MSEPKFTKGPWKYKTYPNARVDSKTCIESNEHRICLIKHTPHYGNVEANAQLISGAPDLYEALVECEKLVNDNCVEWDKIPKIKNKIKQALSRARGE